jgi:hypothetical protein
MERLDSARTAAARASPLGDTLELAAVSVNTRRPSDWSTCVEAEMLYYGRSCSHPSTTFQCP